MLRIVLLDDEPLILEDMIAMLQNDARIEIAGAYSNPLALLAELPSLEADCLFLDIEMPELNGTELAEQIQASNTNLEIVFVTAFNHYAAQAFEVNAIDYLLKPIRPERINKTMDKLVMSAQRSADSKPENGSYRICCFGAFEVNAGDSLIRWTRSKSRELLAYLLQHEGKWLSKYKLCDEQWGDYEPDRALAYLQTSLYALRKNLREAGIHSLRIEYSDDKYRLIADQGDWDMRKFEAAYELFKKTGALSAAQQALSYYRGEYLEGEDWHWSDITREEYHCRVERLKQVVHH